MGGVTTVVSVFTKGRSGSNSDGLVSTVTRGWLDFCLLRHFQGIIDLDSQVSDGAFKLRMT